MTDKATQTKAPSANTPIVEDEQQAYQIAPGGTADPGSGGYAQPPDRAAAAQPFRSSAFRPAMATRRSSVCCSAILPARVQKPALPTCSR